ncbi:pentatricopeptide repeat-containing protein At4g39530 isoform X2 [Arachis ipaensis]|uniref:pentatricopeptide repeat-containing protein At4g39530 isoform X2 n=1 Tax=Arachis ipaensis TaxID=130454 RepID=UPI000A2B778E|nr:pentatricopeptide repeat-containing protein At4g39530 isoform X2 [Arachis ipaensis]XP_029150299.1 pentatricopeptide repeat-containing protein At4g39530 isoform X2 [Arachis hypogaea]
MSNSNLIFDYVIQFLRKCRHHKHERLDMKKVHGYLVRRGILFRCHRLHTGMMATYAAGCPHSFANKKLQTLMNKFLRCISINSTNPIHFNAIISDSSRMGLPFLALTTFSFMHSNAIPLDTYAFCSTLNASSTLADVHFPKQIHAHLAKSGWSSSVFVASALIDLYSKLSTLKDAVLVFDETPHKNTVCANALLSGYVHAGFWVEQLELVRKMPVLKLKYDHFTLSAALRACTGLSAIELGRQLHSYLLRTIRDIESDVFLQSALIEMYGKCGMVKKAWQVFGLAGTEVKKERSRDVVLWTSMLGVYGRNGHYKEVIALYNEMLVEGIKPDGIAFLTVISACGRTGQVQEGVKAGELHKAWEILNERVGKCSISMWGALLSACVDCGNIELGELAAERALHLDPQNVGICVMLSNLYAKFGMWDRIRELRALINASRLRKDVGCSWVQVTS